MPRDVAKHRWEIAACLVLLAASGLLFYLVPGLDLAISGWFYSAGRGFVMAKTLPVVVMRDIGIWLTIATIVALIAVAVVWSKVPDAKRHWFSDRPERDWAFLVATMAIGPGFLVHVIFKHFWGRARPVHLEQFGGIKHFTPAWVVSDQCGPWNCSFVSGEAAASAMLFAFCVVAPKRWKAPIFCGALAVMLAVSFARLAAGGHFLSDVVTAWLLMVLVILVVRDQVYFGAMLGPLKRWVPIQ